VGTLVGDAVHRFQDTARTLTERHAAGPEGRRLARHIAGLRHWMTGNQRWGTASARYATENIGIEVIPGDIGSTRREDALSGPTAARSDLAAAPRHLAPQGWGHRRAGGRRRERWRTTSRCGWR
ncbi:hypothetical protein ACMZ5M_16130, partial [Streptomyces rhizosphaericola]|uniref:hypothetical protein n=1 Tax=Streptomyces rhizosphaericola TaxID=2564098 RepID=UPI0039F08899